MKVITNVVPKNCHYLTAGKAYEVYPFMSGNIGGDIIDDNGKRLAICFKDSDHLNGADWMILE